MFQKCFSLQFLLLSCFSLIFSPWFMQNLTYWNIWLIQYLTYAILCTKLQTKSHQASVNKKKQPIKVQSQKRKKYLVGCFFFFFIKFSSKQIKTQLDTKEPKVRLNKKEESQNRKKTSRKKFFLKRKKISKIFIKKLTLCSL